jgi:hypothetical protein
MQTLFSETHFDTSFTTKFLNLRSLGSLINKDPGSVNNSSTRLK